jgi:hypothetical protein
LPQQVSWGQTTLGANEPPIFDAARLGSAAEVDKILKANPAMRDARNQLGSTPLHLAATNGDAGPLKALLAAGADVHARDKEDNTPLHMAAYAGKSEAARLLLEAGADVNAKSTGGRTPLSLARKTRADETAGIISLWVLKGCQPGKPAEKRKHHGNHHPQGRRHVLRRLRQERHQRAGRAARRGEGGSLAGEQERPRRIRAGRVTREDMKRAIVDAGFEAE